MAKTKKPASPRDLTVRQLRFIATKRRVTLRSKARKSEIVSMLISSVPAEQLQRDVKKQIRSGRIGKAKK